MENNILIRLNFSLSGFPLYRQSFPVLPGHCADSIKYGLTDIEEPYMQCSHFVDGKLMPKEVNKFFLRSLYENLTFVLLTDDSVKL